MKIAHAAPSMAPIGGKRCFQPRVWLLIAIYFTAAVSTNAAGAYFPTFIKEQYPTTSHLQVGVALCSAEPVRDCGDGPRGYQFRSHR